MRLRDQEDGHSVYVLYSDMLFNLVIIFLITVLALVLRMNNTIKQVTQAPASLVNTDKQTIAQLTQQRDDSRETANTLVQQLAAADERNRAAQAAVEKANAARAAAERVAADAKQEVAGTQQQQSAADRKLQELGTRLSIAAGANRFTGRTGVTSLCVGLDLSGATPQYVLMNASQFNSAMATLDGETDEDHLVRSAKLLVSAARGARRYSAAELDPLFRGLQVRSGGDQSTPQGHLTFSFAGRATAAASGWLDPTGTIDRYAALRDLRRHGNPSLDDTQSVLINALLTKRDILRPAAAPESVPVLHFAEASDHDHVKIAGTEIDVAAFREMVSAFGDGGIILQYDGKADGGAADGITPQWIVRDILTPVGYTNSVPDAQALQQLRSAVTPSGAADR